MTHYVCMGECNGISDEAGNCQNPDCPDYKKALHECNCPDGQSHQQLGHAEEETNK